MGVIPEVAFEYNIDQLARNESSKHALFVSFTAFVEHLVIKKISILQWLLVKLPQKGKKTCTIIV